MQTQKPKMSTRRKSELPKDSITCKSINEHNKIVGFLGTVPPQPPSSNSGDVNSF